MKILKNKIFLSIFILVLALCLFLLWSPVKNYFGWQLSENKNTSEVENNTPMKAAGYQKISLTVNNVTFLAYVADTNEKRAAGLSGWDNLPLNQAMFFVFDQPGQQGIWMKDMKIPLDIVWLDENGTIIYLQENISPDTFPKVFGSNNLSLFVLELPAGFISQNKINLGMTVLVN